MRRKITSVSKTKPDVTVSSAVLETTASLRQKLKLTNEDVEQLKTASQAVLAVLGMVGAAGLLLVAPNMMKVVDVVLRAQNSSKKWSHEEKQQKIIKSLYYLKQSGFIKMQQKPGDIAVRVLPKGLERLARLLHKPAVPKPAKWSGTWWLVAGDVPTKTHRGAADALRRKLLEMQFYPLQRSLWVHPYDPRGLLEPLLQELQLGQYVTLMEVCRLDAADAALLRTHFGKDFSKLLVR